MVNSNSQLIPKWLQRSLTPQDLEGIEQAIGEAETHTIGEIVPMVVEKSSATGHVFYLTNAILFIALVLLGVDEYIALQLDFSWYLAHFVACMILLVLCSGLAMVLSRLHSVQRLCISQDDRYEQVVRRAELEFFEAGLKKTANNTGILIFISMMEHLVIVLADDTIDRHIKSQSADTSEFWSTVVTKITSGIRQKQFATGLCDGIKASGEICGRYFPVTHDNPNELHNHLIIKP